MNFSSLQKSCWLDVFLAELLAQVKEGHDVKDALSFWWVYFFLTCIYSTDYITLHNSI